MKKLITILLIISTGLTYGQSWAWPSMNLYRADQQLQVRNNIMYAVNRGTDSLGKVIRAEMKVQYDAQLKALRDSMAGLAFPDGKTIVVKDGKATATGGTTDLKPVYDSIAKLDAKLTASNNALANSILILSGGVTTTENKVSSLEAWRTETNAAITTINGKIATIPRTAVSTTTTISTSTTTTELKP